MAKTETETAGRRARAGRQVAAGGRGGRGGGEGRRRGEAGAAGRGLEPRHRPPLLRDRRRPPEAPRRPAGRVLDALPRGHRADPGEALRRQGPRLLRLPHPAQRRPRPLQGRRPLPPRGRRRRGPRAGLADDLEDRGGRRPLRGRQGRRQLPRRPARALGAPEDHALVHGQGGEGARANPRHPGAGRQHQRPGDGLDDGRVRQAPRPHAGDLHRQADRPRGLLRPRGGHGARLRLHVPRGGAAPGAQPGRHHLRRPGLRQRRLVGGADHAAARRQDGRPSPTPTERSETTPGSTPTRCRTTSPRAARSPSSRGPRRSTPTTWSRFPATSSSRRRSAA